MPDVYQFTVNNGQGEKTDLSQFKGKVLLVINTASKCGFTPQYKELEQLYQTYHDKGLEILAFPCNQFGAQEPGSDNDIQQFCQLNYGVSFPVMAKVQVNGPEASPLFEHLKQHARGLLNSRAIKWNFTKFLINKNGEVVKRFAPQTKPASLAIEIEHLL